MKKMKLCIAIMCCISALFFIVYAAASPPQFEVTATTDTVKVGDELYLLVELKDNDGFGANQFRVTYDTDKLILESAILGELIPESAITSVNTDIAGEINFSLISVQNITESGNVLTSKFRAKSSGTAKFDFSLLAFADSDGTSLDAAYNDTEITIISDEESVVPSEESENKNNSSGNTDGSLRGNTKDETEKKAEQSEKPTAEEKVIKEISFSDVPETHWAYSQINKTVQMGLFSGTGGGMFSPELPMTRAMFVTVLYRYAGSPQAERTTFTDVADSWYTDAVSWAAENKIVSGTGDNMFSPDRYITRGEISAVLCRYKNGKCADIGSAEGFADSCFVPEWGKEPLAWAIEQGLLTGRDGEIIAFSDNATRAEAAAIFTRFLNIK